jgi:hypothetical protein
MQVAKKRIDFFNSEEGKYVKLKLQHMSSDTSYNTSASYTSNTTAYPDNLLPFVDKHMNFLNTHPQLDAQIYLANLRLMTRIR